MQLSGCGPYLWSGALIFMNSGLSHPCTEFTELSLDMLCDAGAEYASPRVSLLIAVSHGFFARIFRSQAIACH